MPYAAKTRVPVDRTRAEIQALLDKRGVMRFWSSDEPEKGMDEGTGTGRNKGGRVRLAPDDPLIQAGERRLRQVVTEVGFARFRRATETPFNMVLEARPCSGTCRDRRPLV
jgi:hypothetical protein